MSTLLVSPQVVAVKKLAMAVPRRLGPLIFLALACCGLLPYAAGYGAPVNQQSNANYGGEVVVLDANSVTYPKRGYGGPRWKR
jgi:hypothetical protein